MTNFIIVRAFIYIAGNIIASAQNNTNENTVYSGFNASMHATLGHTHTGATGNAPILNHLSLDLTDTYAFTGILTVPPILPTVGAGSVGLDPLGNIFTVFQNSVATHYEAADIKQYYFEKDDFITVPALTPTGPFGFVQTAAGAGAGVNVDQTLCDGAHPGTVSVNTGTDTNGFAGFTNAGNQLFCFSGGRWTLEWMINIPVLSVVGNRFKIRIGFYGDTGGVDATNGVYLRYADNVNSGNWQLVARKGAAETATNSSSAPSAATWYNLKIIVNAAGTLATFYVNGTSIGTVASNIPVLAGNGTNIGCGIVKSLGVTQRTFSADLVQVEYVPTTVR